MKLLDYYLYFFLSLSDFTLYVNYYSFYRCVLLNLMYIFPFDFSICLSDRWLMKVCFIYVRCLLLGLLCDYRAMAMLLVPYQWGEG